MFLYFIHNVCFLHLGLYWVVLKYNNFRRVYWCYECLQSCSKVKRDHVGLHERRCFSENAAPVTLIIIIIIIRQLIRRRNMFIKSLQGRSWVVRTSIASILLSALSTPRRTILCRQASGGVHVGTLNPTRQTFPLFPLSFPLPPLPLPSAGYFCNNPGHIQTQTELTDYRPITDYTIQ